MIRANRQVIRLSVTAQACLLLLVAGSAAAASYRYDRYVPTLKVTEPSTEGGAGSGGSTSPGSGGGASAPTDGSGNAGGTGGNSDGGSGGGGTASPSFFLSTNALDFGSLNRNQTSSSQSLLVTNDSSVGLTGLTLLSGVNFPATTV